jgi:L-arabinose isomerase
MKQLPGLAVQRLMAQGYGFAGEGDWKTAALDRLLKVMSHNQSTGFMEDYTYELAVGQESVLSITYAGSRPDFSKQQTKNNRFSFRYW